ncbi:hypothetical protein LCGC14_1564960, partial [marine sediment metagenome]
MFLKKKQRKRLGIFIPTDLMHFQVGHDIILFFQKLLNFDNVYMHCGRGEDPVP